MNKVLIIANIRKSQGGITTQVKELADSLMSEGVKVETVSTHGSIIDRIRGIYAAYKNAKECDIILGVGCAYIGFFPIIIAYIISVISNKNVVYNFHDGQVKGFIERYYGLINFVIKNNKVIVASKYLDDEFKKYGFNSEIIYNHLNELNIKRINEKGYDKISIMWARSFEKLYRADLALEAAYLYFNKKNIEFHFYGGGSEFKYYKDKYMGNNIYFHGNMERKDLLEEYRKHQIYLNTTEYDNFPMSIVEAGLNNLIVVSSKIGGIESLYNDNEIVFFKSGNIESLRYNVQKVLNNISEYRIYSKNLIEKVKTFKWINVRQKWISALNINNT